MTEKKTRAKLSTVERMTKTFGKIAKTLQKYADRTAKWKDGDGEIVKNLKIAIRAASDAANTIGPAVSALPSDFKAKKPAPPAKPLTPGTIVEITPKAVEKFSKLFPNVDVKHIEVQSQDKASVVVKLSTGVLLQIPRSKLALPGEAAPVVDAGPVVPGL